MGCGASNTTISAGGKYNNIIPPVLKTEHKKKKITPLEKAISAIETTLQYLKRCWYYNTNKVWLTINRLAVASNITHSTDTKTDYQLANYLFKAEFAPIFVRILKYMRGDSISSSRYKEKCVRGLYAICTNFTSSPGFDTIRLELVQRGAVKLLLEELDEYHQIYTKRKLKRTLQILSILVNCVKCPRKLVRTTYRTAKAVPILMKYLRSEEMMVKISSVSILAYIVNEGESEVLASSEGCLALLLGMLSNAVNADNYCVHYSIAGDSFSDGSYGLLATINRLTCNDSNKKEVVQRNGVPIFIRIISDKGVDSDFHQLAIDTLWKLASIKSHVITITSHLQETNTVKVLEDLRNSNNAKLQSAISSLLWELGLPETFTDVKQEKTLNLPPSYEESISQGHVMLSYSCHHQEQVKRIKDILDREGYRVWMSIGNTKNNVLDAVAKAVEESTVVLICISQKYKDSINCQKEASYAVKKEKPIIALVMEENYQADGWLGMLASDILCFDAYSEEKVQIEMPAIIRALGNRGRASKVSKN